MNKADMLKEIEESLNVVNKGLFNADDFDDGNTEEIREIHEMVTGRNQITAIEQSAIIEELSKLRK
ncbi:MULTISPECIES: DUF1128 family protein [Salinicoccus]|jgi:uncharacterized protein YfkK (UPF0435 family)|uniref:DUF1128 domain-containing protein n=1 Tax=Salinicoccus roseus TaxID=45670 RepID=A0A0C2H8L6_9STAP|nr:MULTISPECIES: DUF1128 family protein [Salinicoccus]KIH70170.1 hypothetical protein SN16_09400 [Salinicoccus roseus]MBY8908772.1 DUF1128 domain-containing protein [Salinicoccus roseus]MCC4723484.1 DUF1128 domain-containing protein [Salinicoccus sp. RF5]MCG7333305.1 DUF1128 domain-containing protein [Salinicoccus roseus]MDB0581015.1 DUF1128 family protein [Salinicoccus roseus]